MKIEQFTLEKNKEVFDHSIIQTIAFSAHTLNDTVINQLLLVMLMLILPSLVRVQNRSCPWGQPARSGINHVHDH